MCPRKLIFTPFEVEFQLVDFSHIFTFSSVFAWLGLDNCVFDLYCVIHFQKQLLPTTVIPKLFKPDGRYSPLFSFMDFSWSLFPSGSFPEGSAAKWREGGFNHLPQLAGASWERSIKRGFHTASGAGWTSFSWLSPRVHVWKLQHLFNNSKDFE